MAGSFGFEGGHYDVSTQVGEHVLLPAVRKAAKDTLIIANGFSCQQQIEQMTDRRPLHLAQVLQMALHEGPEGPPGGYPDSGTPTCGATDRSGRGPWSARGWSSASGHCWSAARRTP